MLFAYSWLSMALDLAQMVLDVRKTLNQPSFTCCTTFVTTTLPRIQTLAQYLISWQSCCNKGFSESKTGLVSGFPGHPGPSGPSPGP